MGYTIWKDGQQIESSTTQLKLAYMKCRLKTLNGDVLHVIKGDVTDVYHNKNNRVCYSHTNHRERGLE